MHEFFPSLPGVFDVAAADDTGAIAAEAIGVTPSVNMLISLIFHMNIFNIRSNKWQILTNK